MPINDRAGDCAVPGEAYLNKLARTAGVVVLSFRVTEGFQDRIGLQYLAFKQVRRYISRMTGSGVGLAARPEGY